MVCSEWELGKITTKEALRNLGELIRTSSEDNNESAHYFDAVEKVLDREVPFKESDKELDKSWHQETHGDKDD